MYDLTKDAANAIPFVMVDASGVEVAGLGGTFTVTVCKDGGSFGASAGAKAELAGGWYLYTATAGECDTLGPLALKITGAGCVQQNLVYRVDNGALSAAAVDEILDEVVEGSLTMRQVLRLLLAAMAGRSTGGGTTTITFRDNANSKARITATVDSNGNRTGMTLDGA